MVQRVDRVAARNEEVDEVAVASAVFPIAVGDQQDGARVAIRQPALMVDLDSTFAWERAV